MSRLSIRDRNANAGTIMRARGWTTGTILSHKITGTKILLGVEVDYLLGPWWAMTLSGSQKKGKIQPRNIVKEYESVEKES